MRSKWEDIDFRMTNYRQSDDEYLSVYCYTRFSNLVYDPTIPTAFFRGWNTVGGSLISAFLAGENP